ncbi:hypothetical protein RJ639_017950 [Escallonia herrerae]|uniref:SET domain-containing protein n=1 Tax=Escallonia herrerae TaxID=1293975 RepID=A0AA89AIA3_9ASTE|nr:hypothetical protein RJ639_017950 [Escallonia herrerae]
MAGDSKVAKACKAMKIYGISEETVKPVLNNLLNVFDNNWKFIEDDDYSALIDAIFDREDPKCKEEAQLSQSPKDETTEAKPSSSPQYYNGKGKNSNSPLSCSVIGQTRPSKRCSSDQNAECATLSPLIHVEENEETSVSLKKVRKTSTYERETRIVPWREAKVMSRDEFLLKDEVLYSDEKDHRPFADDLPLLVDPLAVIHPAPAPPALLCEEGPSDVGCSSFGGNGSEIQDFNHLHVEDKEIAVPEPSQIEIAASLKGEIKIALIRNLPQQSGFRIPSLGAVLKTVEDKFLKSYKVAHPGFSLLNLLKDVCGCYLKEGTISVDVERVGLRNVLSADVPGGRVDDQINICIPSNLLNGQGNLQNLVRVSPQISWSVAPNPLEFLHCIQELNVNQNPYDVRDREKMERQQSPLYYVDDITRGEEKHKISLVNDFSSETEPAFKYISQSVNSGNADVKFVLARIAEGDCCPSCFGDCTSALIPCACAGETGGEFAYTPGGLVREDFLEKCISMNQDPQQHIHFYCNDCPLERSQDKYVLGTCKGHLLMKFIKECWYRCGCHMKCGNRVVQRGISVKLQVYMTPEGKGWGLRTLEDMPKGSFVCEYVGEIVSNMDLFERNLRNTSEKHTYPVLLDADWGSEGILKDEDALCLDATYYGNVARFINHRCCDANMIEIPVEVETPDHHYYHLAFFTKRKVNALEELTWDYGIDFSDLNHPIKAFKCLCRSKFCRNMKHSKSMPFHSHLYFTKPAGKSEVFAMTLAVCELEKLLLID